MLTLQLPSFYKSQSSCFIILCGTTKSTTLVTRASPIRRLSLTTSVALNTVLLSSAGTVGQDSSLRCGWHPCTSLSWAWCLEMLENRCFESVTQQAVSTGLWISWMVVASCFSRPWLESSSRSALYHAYHLPLCFQNMSPWKIFRLLRPSLKTLQYERINGQVTSCHLWLLTLLYITDFRSSLKKKIFLPGGQIIWQIRKCELHKCLWDVPVLPAKPYKFSLWYCWLCKAKGAAACSVMSPLNQQEPSLLADAVGML